MKNLFNILTILLISTLTRGNSHSIEPSHKIRAVTVFSQGAMVSREIEIKNQSGNQTLEIKELPNNIYKKSIILESDKNIEVVSLNSYLKSQHDAYDKQVDSINTLLHIIGDSINYKNTLSNILVTEKNMIIKHNDFTSKDGNSNIDDVIKASDFYKKRIKEIDLEMLLIKKDLTKLNSEVAASREDLKSLQIKRNTKYYQVDIKIKTKPNTSGKLTLKYFVPNAQWHPFYDLKVLDTQNPAILSYKAYVSQNTGEDWSDVKLTLSNARPTESNELPSLNPKELRSPEQRSRTIEGKILDSQGQPLIGANVLIQGTTNGTISDIDGNFILHHASSRNIEVSYTGFKTKYTNASQDYNVIVLHQSELLDEVVVTGYTASKSSISVGSTSDGIRINKKREKDLANKLKQEQAMRSVRQAVKMTKSKVITDVEYIIEERYSLPSNNKEIDVLLEVKTVPCDYEYLAVPSQSSKTFLTLQVDDWHALDLLAGNVNLFLGQTYKGTSAINPNITDKTLSISVGSDPDVIVQHKLQNEDYDKKFLNKNIEETFAYGIKVKNNKSHPIRIKILDQIPISTHENIEIKNIKTGNGQLEEKSGKVTWETEIQPGASKEEILSYSIKYPREYGNLF